MTHLLFVVLSLSQYTFRTTIRILHVKSQKGIILSGNKIIIIVIDLLVIKNLKYNKHNII